MNEYCVITTINEPTEPVEVLASLFDEGNMIVIGDKKTPLGWQEPGVTYISPENQSLFTISDHLPFNHYSRKNIGYLVAIKNKATLIYDTDDDNYPDENWEMRESSVLATQGLRNGWANIYSEFTDSFVWPRGLPLSDINNRITIGNKYNVESYIQQGLANNDADMDAICRLVFKGHRVNFSKEQSIILSNGCWCPFNSQSTWWFPEAYPLLYLPINCSFRMTDIWRSFIAQRCLWEMGSGVTFHSPAEVIQERNEHDLMKDFAEEIEGYLNNDKIRSILEKLTLKGGKNNTSHNLRKCYESLIVNNIFPLKEMISVEAWINDYENTQRTM